jgi:ATP-dependent DNA helicase RecG
VEFKKDIYNEEYLSDLGLNERQIEALLFFKSSRVVTSSEYQAKFEISERTARYGLVNLVEKQLLIKIGDKKSTKYEYI